jgi:anti-anti-sigma factor
MSASVDLDPEFAVEIRISDLSAVLEVRGEIDVRTAPDLGSILDAVVERHQLVVLDLGELGFMDAAGLRVIAQGAMQLRRSGGELAIRSPSKMIVRMLEFTGMASSLRIEGAASDPDRLPAQQPFDFPVRSVTEGERSAAESRTITAIPADADVIDSALRLVVALTRAAVGGADGVSVSLQRHGRLHTVAASDQTITSMDASQYETGEGPCVDASTKGERFLSSSLEDEARWPEFTPKALGLGIKAILSSPLLVEERPVGAINIYSRRPEAFEPRDQELAAVFATEASLILRTGGVTVTAEELSERLGAALESRRTIARAEGIVMAREGIAADEAFRLLRHLSARSNLSFQDRAAEIVASTVRTGLRDEPSQVEGPRG